jgi:hypothetical protein
LVVDRTAHSGTLSASAMAWAMLPPAVPRRRRGRMFDPGDGLGQDRDRGGDMK